MTITNRESSNLSKRLEQLESRTDIQLEEQGRRLHALEKENKRLHKAQTALFVGCLAAVMVAFIALAVAYYKMDTILQIRGQQADIIARLTEITAEIRGIGG